MADYEIKDGVGIIPDSVKMVGDNAFSGCTALKIINVPANKIDFHKKHLPEEQHSLINFSHNNITDK